MIYKTTSGKYSVRVPGDRGADGRRVFRTVGTYNTKREAEKAELDADVDRDSGVSIAPATLTVSDLVTQYVDHRSVLGRGEKTIEEYRGTLRLYIEPSIGRVKVSKLKAAMVSAWLAKLMTSGSKTGGSLAPKTVKHAYSLLSASLTWGMTIELATRNVCVAVQPPSVPKTTVTALTAEEMADMGDTADDSRWGYFVALSILLGTRRGETLALNWSDVNYDDAQVQIRKSMSQTKGKVFQKSTKNGRERTLQMNDAVTAAFRRQRAQQAADQLRAGAKYVVDAKKPVFTDPLGKRQSPESATNAYSRLAKKAGISSTRLHAARHTMASLLLRLGVDPVTVSAILGHSNPTVTLGVYGHLIEGECQTVLGTDRSRVVSAAEYEQVLTTNQFEVAGGAEGKYFWEDLNDAIPWSGTFTNSWIIEAKYPAAMVESFYTWDQLDGLGPARFAGRCERRSAGTTASTRAPDAAQPAWAAYMSNILNRRDRPCCNSAG